MKTFNLIAVLAGATAAFATGPQENIKFVHDRKVALAAMPAAG